MRKELTIDDLQDRRYYKLAELSSILKNLGLPFSIFKIRELEQSGRITSPRTAQRTKKGFGHRRYTKEQILEIVKLLSPKQA